MPTKVKHTKPTVFLSHSANNRRELMALKRLLDARAGGMIDFFLSSDDESITHGTIWPAAVHAALNRMKLMLVFVSPAALESQWTFFEAGYGLCKLDSAKIYCLPGTFKDKLPPPFNLLQNRNLHSAHDIALLIHQINEALQSHIPENVTKQEFEEIFRRPLFARNEAGPRLSEVIERIKVTTEGPANSEELFEKACEMLGHTPVLDKSNRWSGNDSLYSTGVRIEIAQPHTEEVRREIKITDEMRHIGYAEIDEDLGASMLERFVNSFRGRKTIAEIEAYNATAKVHNAEIRRKNEIAMAEPRFCQIYLSSSDLSISTPIIDQWIKDATPATSLSITVELLSDVTVETRGEALAAKVYRSPLVMQMDGSMLWQERVNVRIDPPYGGTPPKLDVTSRPESKLSLSDFQLEQLINTLCELQIVVPPPGNKNRRR